MCFHASECIIYILYYPYPDVRRSFTSGNPWISVSVSVSSCFGVPPRKSSSSYRRMGFFTINYKPSSYGGTPYWWNPLFLFILAFAPLRQTMRQVRGRVEAPKSDSPDDPTNETCKAGTFQGWNLVNSQFANWNITPSFIGKSEDFLLGNGRAAQRSDGGWCQPVGLRRCPQRSWLVTRWTMC